MIVARRLVERVLGEDAEVLAHLPGAALEGVRYEALFDFIKGEDFGPLGHSVLLADFVSTEEGTDSSTPRLPSATTTSSSASEHTG